MDDNPQGARVVEPGGSSYESDANSAPHPADGPCDLDPERWSNLPPYLIEKVRSITFKPCNQKLKRALNANSMKN